MCIPSFLALDESPFLLTQASSVAACTGLCFVMYEFVMPGYPFIVLTS